jgi:protein subunit release factor B
LLSPRKNGKRLISEGLMEHVTYETDRAKLEAECDLEFFKASGPGGQHRNKRETAVRIHHRPSGVTVAAVERRSQAMNREEAFRRLVEKLEKLNRRPKKRRPTRVSAAEKERRLTAKRQRAKTKSARRAPADEV